MARCGANDISRNRVEGILERVRAVLFESISCKCNGAGGIRRRDADIEQMRTKYFRVMTVMDLHLWAILKRIPGH